MFFTRSGKDLKRAVAPVVLGAMGDRMMFVNDYKTKGAAKMPLMMEKNCLSYCLSNAAVESVKK
jgi:hypothetical protein